MKILVFVQTARELQWASRQAGLSNQQHRIWHVVRLGGALDEPVNKSELPENCRIVSASDLDIDGERVWNEHRTLQAEFWEEIDFEPRRNLQLATPLAFGNQLFHILYADTIVSAALEKIQPDEVKIPPCWLSKIDKRFYFSFKGLQRLARTVTYRYGITCRPHWSSKVQQALGTPLVLVDQILRYVLIAAYDCRRLADWLQCRLMGYIRSTIARRKSPPAFEDISSGISNAIVFVNADTDLDRQFDIRNLPLELRERSLVWINIEQRRRFWVPCWRQYKLSAYLEAWDKSLAGVSCTDLRKVLGACFPTFIVPLMLRTGAKWYCSVLPVRKPGSTSERLRDLLGAYGTAGERFLNWRRMLHIAKCFALALDILKALRPALVVVGNTVEVHRAITLAAKQCGIRTLASSHAIDIQYDTIANIFTLADVQARFGQKICHFLELDIPASPSQRIVCYDSRTKLPASFLVLNDHSADRHRRVMVVTSLYTLTASNLTNDLFVQRPRYEDMLWALAEAFAKIRPEVEVTLKSHPLIDEYDLYEKIRLKFQPVVNLHWRAPLNASHQIPADVVVFYNCFSTLFFSIVAQGIPVLAHWGAFTHLALQQLPVKELLGSHDSASLGNLVQEVLDEPSGRVAHESYDRARSVYHKFIQPTTMGLTNAIRLALCDRCNEPMARPPVARPGDPTRC